MKHSLLLGLAIALMVAAQSASADLAEIIPVADTTLFENDPNNNLGAMFCVAGTIQVGKKSRALFKFDVADALPPGATVTSVTLQLKVRMGRGAGQNYILRRMQKDWGEGIGDGVNGGGLGTPAQDNEATWNARLHPGTLWATPGGQAGTDFAGTGSATSAMASDLLDFSSAAMVADVQMWLDTPSTNFGWMVMVENEGINQLASHIYSREETDFEPVLSIEYEADLPPAPATPPSIFDLDLIGNQIRFSFSAESNRTYAVEFRDSLTTMNWSVLSNLAAQPVAATRHFTNAALGAERYFRVRTP